jgi:hypothetical protein
MTETRHKSHLGALKHGAFSSHIRKRYSDKRTREGRQLESVIQGLIADLGGADNLSAAQLLLLDSLRSKIIVIFQISGFVDRQASIVTEKGELLPCLGRNFTSYCESVRRDLEALFAVGRRPARVSYEKALKAIEGGKRD